MKTRIAVGAFIEKDGKILMGQKPKDVGPYPNTWHLPGGGVDKDESLLEALTREVKEETGLDVVEARQLFFSDDKTENKHHELTHYIFLVYKVKTNNAKPEALDDLVILEWIDKDQIDRITLTKPSLDLFKYLKKENKL